MIFNPKTALTTVVAVTAALATSNANAGQSVNVPMPFTYDFNMDPSNSSCTNTSTSVNLTGPLSVTRGRPAIMVRFKQNEKRDGMFLSEATIDVSPTQGTMTANKKSVGGMGNPYIAFYDPNSDTFGQLGRCVTPSSKSVYNRLQDHGNGSGLLAAALSAGSCSTKGSSVNLNTSHMNAGVDGTIFLTNQLIYSASDYATHSTSDAGRLTVTLLDPINQQRKGTPSGVGGNPFVSMQVAECSGYLNQDGSVNLPACKAAISAQYTAAVAAGDAQFASYFPYDLNGNRTDNSRALSSYGPALVPETTPVRCNKL